MPSPLFETVDDIPDMTYFPDMDQLLSAASYPQTTSTIPIGNRSEKQLYGGIVTAVDSGEEEEAIAVRPKKRVKPNKTETTKPNGNTQEAPKRQRGRPKVSTKDETAAERRRTQIRLAQRAYRNRKENTITELDQKVRSLESVIKSLNTSFSRLRETLFNSGMIQNNSVVARQVDDLMQNLSEALEVSPSDEDKTSEEEESEVRGMENRHQHSKIGGKAMSMSLQGQKHPVSPRPVVDVHSDLLGVDTDYSMLDLRGHSLTDFQNHPALRTSYPTSYASRTGAPRIPSPQVSASNQRALMSISRFPEKQSYTYSFQETTFARRLHRLCIERAFQKLMSPHVDPGWLLKTFRFTFNFSTTEKIISALRDVLSRGTDEPLENWRSPFIHIGGAGLHYPRRNHRGEPVYPPNLLDPGRTSGPWPQNIPPSNSLQGVLESVGFEGLWYDCRDVEEYLKTKGIFPSAQATFVVVDSALAGLPTPPGSDVVGTLTTGSSPESHHSTSMASREDGVLQPKTMSGFEKLSARADVALDAHDLTSDWLGQQRTFDASDFDFDFSQPTFETDHKESRMLTIEIEKFIERIADESVCLGRAPGFRKEHVDSALLLAMQEAF